MQVKPLLMILFFILSSWLALPVDAEKPAQDQSAWSAQQKEDYYKKQEYNKYAGYTIDGVASASQLAAQRSHTVAGEDERNFAVFTGIVVVLIVIGFSQIVFNKK